MKTILMMIICVVSLCLLFNKYFQYLVLEYAFSIVAPTTENENQKKLSNELYDIKFDLENKIKLKYDGKQKINKVDTLNYSDIKNKLDRKYFSKITNKYTKPIIIKSVYTNDEIAKYNFDTMKKNYGNILVDAIKYNDNGIGSRKVPFEKYIDMITNGEKYYLTVNNSLANAIDSKRFMDFYGMLFDSNTGFGNMFIGNKNSFTHLHSEIAASCATQLHGTKKWYLIDPKYSEHLHSIPDKNKIFRSSLYGFNKRNPIIDDIPRYEVVCEQGDFLYVPPWWWHETLNVTDENIMFSFRPSLFVAPYKTKSLYTLMGIQNSLAFNDFTWPLLTQSGLIDPNEDTVVNSIKEIQHRLPLDRFKQANSQNN